MRPATPGVAETGALWQDTAPRFLALVIEYPAVIRGTTSMRARIGYAKADLPACRPLAESDVPTK